MYVQGQGKNMLIICAHFGQTKGINYDNETRDFR